GLGLFCILASFTTKAQTPNVELTPVATGLSAPIYVTHCGDERLFIIEQAGRIRVKQPGSPTGSYTTFLDITAEVVDGGEKGLLGLAFHPDYKNNGYFFVNYTNNGGGPSGKSVLARYSVDPVDSNVALVASGVVLDTIHQPYSNHNGGCIQFGADGYLYMGMGDGGAGNDPENRAQNMMSKLGKMLRYDVNNPDPPYYFVPSTNPFVGNPNYRPEIWASGLRNPWRFSFDRLTGDMWIGDVGQNAREEIDFQPASSVGGENYGWRCYEGMIETPGIPQVGCPGITEVVWPVIDYTHSGGDCSITGGYVYRGTAINGLYGRYLNTDYCSGKIRMLTKNSAGTYVSTQLIDAGGMTSFGEDVYGELYVCLNSTVSKITSPDCEPVAVILSDSLVAACPGNIVTLNAVEGVGLSYQWLQNGIALVGNTASQLVTNDTATYSVVVTNDLGCSTESNVVTVASDVDPVDAQISPVANVCHDSFGTIFEANPGGGTFSGTNIDANGFFNAVAASYGTQTVYYTYVDSAACNAVVMDTATFEFIAPVEIELTIPYWGSDSTIVCLDGGPAFG
ncbi:MAG TPA: PQQ-dependent sugar dehydrogenase, partial [Chitinophagales bacterium]|nr:PQQ-dependent sugar dehydrogenase [Chitinophagales bacterium]